MCARLKRIGIDTEPYVLSLMEEQEAIIYDYQVPAFAEALNVSAEWLYHDMKYVRPYQRRHFE